MPNKLILSILALVTFSATLAGACTKQEAIDYANDHMLYEAGCEFIKISDLKKDWWGGQYYDLTVNCSNDPKDLRSVIVAVDPKTNSCSIAY